MRHIKHPGPVNPKRYFASPTTYEEVTVTIGSQQDLKQEIMNVVASKKWKGGCFFLQQAPVRHLSYFMPADAPDLEHVAWFSDEYQFEQGQIDTLGMMAGLGEQGPYFHGHGAWSDAAGNSFIGHIIPEKTFLNAPITCHAIGFLDGNFCRRFDEETNFTLLFPEDHQAKQVSAHEEAILLKLAPNQDISHALVNITKELGWEKASFHGVGSLQGTYTENDGNIEDHAVEFLITKAIVQNEHSEIEVISVGKSQKERCTGTLIPGQNSILITAELIGIHRHSKQNLA